MKIAPRRVLDVGVEFGWWGAVIREFCELREARGTGDDRAVRIEGIASPARNVAAHHASTYDAIHEGDPADVVSRLEDGWDVIIIGDMLTRLGKDAGRQLLKLCVERSAYALVNLSLGGPWVAQADGASAGAASAWNIEDFAAGPLVRRQVFQDHAGRPFGTFILSRQDPKGLSACLFSTASEYDTRAAPLAAAGAGEPEYTIAKLREITGRVRAEARLRGERDAELAYIRQHRSYRLAERLRRSRLYRLARYLRTGDARMITVRALGERHPASGGQEVWLLAAAPNHGAPAVPWEFVEADGGWELREAPDGAYGRALVSTGGVVRIPADQDPELRFVSHAWSGKVEIVFGWRREVIDLCDQTGGQRIVRPAQVDLVTSAVEVKPTHGAPAASASPEFAEPRSNGRGRRAAAASSRAEIAAAIARRGRSWAESLGGEEAAVAAVCCPRWRGVTASTRALFRHVYLLPATAEEDPYRFADGALEAHARVLLDAGIEHLVLSGGDEAQLELALLVKRAKPEVRCDLVWHGNYTHFGEDYHWRMLARWIEAARDGTVHTIATVKKGMEAFLDRAGVRSQFLLNHLEGRPMDPPTLEQTPVHIGIWLSGSTPLKTPFPMLAAGAFLDDVRVHAAGVGPEARRVLEFFDIPTGSFSEAPIPHADLAAAIRRTHLSIYATFVECCPMLPLESLALGVPCLIGPSSHLFEEDEFLFNRLVVPFPDRAEVIAFYARRAIEERTEIIEAYRTYASAYNERARRAVRDLLELQSPAPSIRIQSGANNGVKPLNV